MDFRVDDLLRQVKELSHEVGLLRQEVVMLQQGGCDCEEPDWYFANLISVYRCGKCGAILSPKLMPHNRSGI